MFATPIGVQSGRRFTVKAVSEQGIRLNISPATLREWRREFAGHLRDQGIAANATERAVRGEPRARKTDGIYRATKRGDSSPARKHCSRPARKSGAAGLPPPTSSLPGAPRTPAEVRHFLDQMPLPRTERQLIARELQKPLRDHTVPEPHRVR